MNRISRIAMWSGPRNISTALMRSWGNRRDTHVCDEPLYAAYLAATGLPHPGRDEILAVHETDWQRAVEPLIGPLPEQKRIFYQKHMAHHLLPQADRRWLASVSSCFLIREPTEMLASLLAVWPTANMEDTGLRQQLQLFDSTVETSGTVPPVIDARDVLEHPTAMLTALCATLGVPFDPAMLQWPPGPRKTDGVWGKHWYDRVNQSTGFAPHIPKARTVPRSHQQILAECYDIYHQLYEHRLQP
jgi:hypothetical protein